MAETSSTMATESNDWHQLFGVVIAHQTVNLPYTLEVDYNVDRTEQRIDILLRKDDPNAPQPILPDGFENLRIHNLFSFKSFQETLDLFTIRELLLYGLLYQKMQAPKGQTIVPDDDVSLYAVSTRYPRDLFKTPRLDIVPATGVSGVYDVWYGPSYLRLIVIQELALEARNANFFLFSSREDQVQYAQSNHRLTLPQYQYFVTKLMARFNPTGGVMPKLAIPTKAEMVREVFNDPEQDKAVLRELLAGVPDELRIQDVSTTVRLKDIPVADRLEGLSPNEIEELTKLLKEKAKETDNPSDS